MYVRRMYSVNGHVGRVAMKVMARMSTLNGISFDLEYIQK